MNSLEIQEWFIQTFVSVTLTFLWLLTLLTTNKLQVVRISWILTKLYCDRSVRSTTRQQRTDQQEETRLGCDAVKAAPFVKRRSRVRRDLSLLRSRRSNRGSSCLGAAHRSRRYVRRFSISSIVISAGWCYFGDAILFYFIVSLAVLWLCSIRLKILRCYFYCYSTWFCCDLRSHSSLYWCIYMWKLSKCFGLSAFDCECIVCILFTYCVHFIANVQAHNL